MIGVGKSAEEREKPVFIRYWGSHFKIPWHVHDVVAQFQALVNKGWQCHLVVSRLPEVDSWRQTLSQAGVNLICLPRPHNKFDLKCIASTFRLCRQLRCSAFQCDNIHASPMIGASLAGVPVRAWFKRSMSAHFEECRTPTLIERFALSTRLTCFLATKVLAVSNSVKKELVSLGVPESKVLVHNNPRRLGSLDPADRDPTRRSWGFPGSEVVIMTLGHAVPVKGWDVLVRAFAKVAPAEPRARLVLVGSYQSHAEKDFVAGLKTFLDANHLANKVHFAGQCSSIKTALAGADIFALPSRSEGCSNALIEGLEAGLPCVATRVGHAEEIIQDGINGLLVKRDDEDSLADALLRLVENEAKRAEFAQRSKLPAAVPTVREYFERIAQDYESLFLKRAKLSCRELSAKQGRA